MHAQIDTAVQERIQMSRSLGVKEWIHLKLINTVSVVSNDTV